MSFGLSAAGAALAAGGISAAGAMGSAGISALASGSGKKAPKWSPTPYTGRTAPSVDVNGTNYLRGTQKLTNDLLQNRAQGNDIGYAPEWMKANQQIINSDEARRVRGAQGSLSAAGLSGNARALEATTGREKQYTADELAKLTVADMERKASDKYGYTGMLQNLNQQQFGQENTAAAQDLSKWSAENGMGLNAANMDNSNYWKGQAQNQDVMTDVGTGVGGAAGALSGMFQPKGVGIASPSASALSPSADQWSMRSAPLAKTKLSGY